MAGFLGLRARDHLRRAHVLLVLSSLIIAVSASCDEGSCSSPEPVVGSALMQLKTGKRPKQAREPRKMPNESNEWDAALAKANAKGSNDEAKLTKEREEINRLKEQLEMAEAKHNQQHKEKDDEASQRDQTEDDYQVEQVEEQDDQQAQSEEEDDQQAKQIEEQDDLQAAESERKVERQRVKKGKKKEMKKEMNKEMNAGKETRIDEDTINADMQAESEPVVANGMENNLEQSAEKTQKGAKKDLGNDMKEGMDDTGSQTGMKDIKRGMKKGTKNEPETDQETGVEDDTTENEMEKYLDNYDRKEEMEDGSKKGVANDLEKRMEAHRSMENTMQKDPNKEEKEKSKADGEGADVSKLASKIGAHGICKKHPCRLTSKDAQTEGIGHAATLDETGYQQVAAIKDDAEMAEFVARVIDECDFKVENMKGLMNVVPWFSGTIATQNIEALEDALLNAAVMDSSDPWLSYRNTGGVTAGTAELGVIGYVQVAMLKDDAAMKIFAKKMCKQLGVKIIDEGAFESMVDTYTSSLGFKSYERLQAEIRSAANAPNSWAKWKKHPAVLASTEHVLSGDATAFTRVAGRIATKGFCTRYPCQSLLAAPHRHQGIGRTASLDEAGYKQVARLKDDEEMHQYILRVIAEYDCKVAFDGGLSGIVPWFSGTTEVQSFAKLQEVLLFAIIADPKHAWLQYRNTARVNGANAELSLQGYVQVAALKSTSEMKKFGKRMCESLGVNIVNEGGFEGMINYYSGAEHFQSYERLVSEIKSAAKAPRSWAQVAAPETSTKH